MPWLLLKNYMPEERKRYRGAIIKRELFLFGWSLIRSITDLLRTCGGSIFYGWAWLLSGAHAVIKARATKLQVSGFAPTVKLPFAGNKND